MLNEKARDVTKALYESAAPFLRITGVHDKFPRWCRNVAEGDHRRGPWLRAVYEVIDAVVWGTVAPCIYVVRASDDGFRYVGVSKNRLKDRWRLSPGFDETLTTKLPEKQLFHSQCWKNLEREIQARPKSTYEVRVLFGEKIAAFGRSVSGNEEVGKLIKSAPSSKELPGLVEGWLRQHKYRTLSPEKSLFPWNAA